MTPTKPAGEIPTNKRILPEYQGFVKRVYMES